MKLINNEMSRWNEKGTDGMRKEQME